MRTIEYFSCDDPRYWLAQIGKSDWNAGQWLHRALMRNDLSYTVGKNPKVFLLTEGDRLVSFCTYTEKDDIQPTELTPWIGFVYTFPQYRGRGHIGKLFEHIEALAAKENIRYIYLSTNHTGLYEKYGFEFYQMMDDIKGEPSRVYRKLIGD